MSLNFRLWTIELIGMVVQILKSDDGSPVADRCEMKGLIASTAPLEKIFILTPVPAAVLD